jgi:hypothetical protein
VSAIKPAQMSTMDEATRAVVQKGLDRGGVVGQGRRVELDFPTTVSDILSRVKAGVGLPHGKPSLLYNALVEKRSQLL